MRSYGQYCALAKALDVVGDRWTLLIVRELLIRKAARYTDLRDGLPGIATNLLAERLRELVEVGVVARDEAPPPVAATLYRLTPRGTALKAAVAALGAWGGPAMGEIGPDEEFRSHWLALPIELRLRDGRPEARPVVVEVRTGEEPIYLRTQDGTVRVESVPAEKPDAIVEGRPRVVLGLLYGELSLARARRAGVRFRGDFDAIVRLRPIA
jgi:DNA-binding HxlR family transcriptional regulator